MAHKAKAFSFGRTQGGNGMRAANSSNTTTSSWSFLLRCIMACASKAAYAATCASFAAALPSWGAACCAPTTDAFLPLGEALAEASETSEAKRLVVWPRDVEASCRTLIPASTIFAERRGIFAQHALR